jgi:predicted metal-dependent HD superfamily phosphohydrolase
MSLMADLLGRWRAATGLSAEEAGRDMLARWAEPHRRYHTVDHLVAVLSIVDGHAGHAEDPDAVRLAAWFHDAVYDPRASPGVNESRSAELAHDTLASLGVSAARIDEVARLVRLTAHHAPAPGDHNGELLCDADLAVLAGSTHSYDGYAAAIRQEYAHVPDTTFRAGRAAVLRHLLELPVLFRIPALRANWESRARANIRRELTTLEAAADEG